MACRWASCCFGNDEDCGVSGPGKLSKRLRLQIFLRSLSLQASWNHERMQNVGLLVTLKPWLTAQPRDRRSDRLFVRRYYEFFNTNPYLANFVVGGLIRLESERLAGVEPPPGVPRMFRDSLARAFAGLGDQLYWLGIRPTVVMAICLLGLYGQMTAIIGLVAVFAGAQMVVRWQSLGVGFRLGFDLVEVLQDRRWHQSIALVEKVGMVLTGATAGVYLSLVTETGSSGPGWLLWLGAGAGVVLPLVLKRRLPGEFLVLVALLLAAAVTFAISLLGS